MKRITLVLALACVAAAGPPAAAEMCALDAVPAATLLLPYFEVDLDASPEVNTVFTVHNALPSPTLAHVAIWTDWSQPVIDFDVFLTGYDAQTVDLHEVLVDGNLPVTADEQSDLATSPNAAVRAADPTSSCDGTDDSCSPHGRADWDGSFDGAGIFVAGVADCIDIFPWFINPLLSTSRLQDVQNRLTGQPIDGSCHGGDHGDGRARGYLTIDNVNACSLIFPSDPGYFDAGGTGVASNVNQLWGDWSLIDPDNLRTFAVEPLIHIEADDDFDASSTPTDYTFYGRYTQSQGGIDNREPLGSVWSVSYFNVGFGGSVTDLIVWRDSTADNQDYGGYACSSGPDWQPLDQTQVVCFDEAENALEICSGTACFPLESQRLEIGAGDLDVPWGAGWCYLNLNIPGDAPTGDVDFPASPAGNIAQSWVGAAPRRGPAFSGGLHAVLESHACQDANPLIEDLGRADRAGGHAGRRPKP